MSASRSSSLQAVLDRQAGAVAPSPAKEETATPPAPNTDKFFRPSREGRKLIAGHFEPKVAKQLKILAAEEGTTVQALLEEALDLLFVKKGRGAIGR